jgi:2-oxoglutarate ferredoxin oxidoreductase subunit alpha
VAVATPTPHQREQMVIRFAGDSGDGMQLAGTRFTAVSAFFGNDLATFPSFPAEIRAPQGTLPGVSMFQVHIADKDIFTPGDLCDVLVAMNPAALKSNGHEVAKGGVIIVNKDAFTQRNLDKAGYESNPLTDGSLEGFHLLETPMEKLTDTAVKKAIAPLQEELGEKLSGRDVLRAKNFFALGLLAFMFSRPTSGVIDWVRSKFEKTLPLVAAANIAAFRAGYNFGITTEEFAHFTYDVHPAPLPSGVYTNINGNQAAAWGLIAAGQLSGLPLFYGSYPITPASSILEELARNKHFNVRTVQAEDEIAAVGFSLGAAFAGSLAATGTSGPGIALKSETISLAFQMELPLVVVNVQRAGPSTGMPTKTEQADLLMAMYGRHGEAPLPIVAAATPSDAFAVAVEACRIALKYMTPVLMLSDGYIATGSEPWLLPDVATLPGLHIPFAKVTDGETFLPYSRDPDTHARPWAIPGTPGLEHRIGGLEHAHETGNVSYNAENHEQMTLQREAKVAAITADIPAIEIFGTERADLLVLGWGSTFGAIRSSVMRLQSAGASVSHVHLRHLNPFPSDLGDVLASFDQVLVPELNRGQLSKMIRSQYLVDATSLCKVQGLPFKASEISAYIATLLKMEILQ